LQRSVHVFALVVATRLKAERCTANGGTLQQSLSILRNAPASLCPGYRLFKNCLYFLNHPRTTTGASHEFWGCSDKIHLKWVHGRAATSRWPCAKWGSCSTMDSF
jgi:hypothetical protein